MFNNIGRKIKGLAKFVCWFGIAMGALVTVAAIIVGVAFSIEVDEPLIAVGIGFLAIIYFGLNFLLCWISSWTCYAYGELVDKTDMIDKRLASGVVSVKVADYGAFSTPVNTPASTPANDGATTVFGAVSEPAPEPEIKQQKYKCPTCNSDVYMGDAYCTKCGQKFNWDNI